MIFCDIVTHAPRPFSSMYEGINRMEMVNIFRWRFNIVKCRLHGLMPSFSKVATSTFASIIAIFHEMHD